MNPSIPPVADGDDATLTLDTDLENRPEVPVPGHPTVFLDDGPVLEEPAAG